ncbi:MAG: TonB C-terminal domain-containing protein [Candidatus Fermentibacteraceae bacterium]|nr:TonB C-terminal domain-containing protein [Candidatus Fermentibacteraceae bacterium]MBN2609812.1 TonB C-terminal domain-containing protein [Candidatus Fermentibacteraceae bacterium]
MSFNDREPLLGKDYSPRRLDYILAGAGHLILLLVGAITFSSSASTLTGGDDAVMVHMVTMSSSSEAVPEELTVPEEVQEAVIQEEVQENPEEVQEEISIPEEVQENPEETPEENPEEVPEEVTEETPQEVIEENPEEVPEEVQIEAEGFAAVSSQGDAGAGAPGPGTYESRVFNAVRRGYRTSVSPQQSYRIVLTVYPDGSTDVEIVRRSGTSAFDRAVENALSMAQIPPMPPGRTSPAVINIEFLGPE